MTKPRVLPAHRKFVATLRAQGVDDAEVRRRLQEMEIPNDQIEAALSAPVATRQLYSKTVSKRYLADAKVYGMGSLGGMLSVGGMMLTYQSYQDSVLSKQEGYTIYYGAMLIGGFLVLVAFITGIRAQLRRKRDTKANQEAATPSVADQPLKPPETNWPEHDRR